MDILCDVIKLWPLLFVFSLFSFEQFFHDFFILKAKILCYFPMCFTSCMHCLNFRQMLLNIYIVSFWHNNTPWCRIIITSGGIVMLKQNYTHVQEHLPEIQAIYATGKTHREIAEYFGFQNKAVVKWLLTRERRKERNAAAKIWLRPKGRPRKDAVPRDVVLEQAYEIRKLKMEINCCEIFCSTQEGSETQSKIQYYLSQQKKYAI